MPATSSDAATAIRRKLLAVLALPLFAGPAVAAGELALAQESGCLSCHRGAAQWIGPSYKDVAERYAGTKDAEAMLARRIVEGTAPAGQGWMADGKARLPFMPPNGVTAADARRLAAWVLGIRAEVVDAARFVGDRVAVSGAVANRVELTVDELRRLPLRELPATLRSGARPVFKGVLLRDVLKQAGLEGISPIDAKKSVIVATAADGWRVVFSWTEVFDGPVGEGALVFLEKDGKPLGDDEGRIALVSTGDARAESRYLKWLRKIEVRRISD